MNFMSLKVRCHGLSNAHTHSLGLESSAKRSGPLSVQKKKDAEKASAAAGKPKHTAGELRMQKGTLCAFDIQAVRKTWTQASQA